MGRLRRLDGSLGRLLAARVQVALAAVVLSVALTAEDCSGQPTTTLPATPTTTAPATATTTPTLLPTPTEAAAAPQPAELADPYPAAKAAGASAVCHDGTWSYSQHRSGTCSSHGGVHWWTGNLGPAGPGAH